MYHLARSAPVLGLTTEHSRLVFAFNTVGLILATIAVCLRVYARRLSQKSFVAEDYLVFLALVSSKLSHTPGPCLTMTLASLLRPGYHDLLWLVELVRCNRRVF